MSKWLVINDLTGEIEEHDNYESAQESYENLKNAIMDDEVVDPNNAVYLSEVKRKSFVVEDQNTKEDPAIYGFDYWVKWQEENLTNETK